MPDIGPETPGLTPKQKGTTMNTTPTTNNGIPAPPDATKLTEWDKVFSVDALHRFFYGTQRGERVRVGINGYQNPDGTVRERWIHVDGQELDAAAARELARALIAAANEFDELEGDLQAENE